MFMTVHAALHLPKQDYSKTPGASSPLIGSLRYLPYHDKNFLNLIFRDVHSWLLCNLPEYFRISRKQ
ncbi:hypothetical protein Y032_0132g1698 [Ancylostoma ceylanicum]|uniref:Uncharacterized protein n=1 Tax=Ancylostoma ceylanicum TaxID=53326 RepID=A0A016T5N6_9BILA|nr:hypothetical protein Y032_0132g1698 [Ancylostoma ceylanicum]